MKHKQFFNPAFMKRIKKGKDVAVAFKRVRARWYLREYRKFQKEQLICRRHFLQAPASMGGFLFILEKNRNYFKKPFRFAALNYVLFIEGDRCKLKTAYGRGSIYVGSLNRKYGKCIFN